MIRKNIVLVGDHGSGKKIFVARLCNNFELTSFININLYLSKETDNNVTYTIKDEDLSVSRKFTFKSKDKCIEYQFNIDVIQLDAVPKYDFSVIDAVLFFSDGSLSSQIAIEYMDKKYVYQWPLRRAIFCPDSKDINYDIISYFNMTVKWPCSTSDNATVQYVDSVIRLFSDDYANGNGIYEF